MACAALALSSARAHAQLRPDAGSIQRDLEQQPLEAPKRRSPLSTEPARPALSADEKQRFTVASLRVSGNTAFDSATLLALVRGELVGKSVTLAQLQAAAAKITAYYRERGYLVARAYIPAQRIDAARAEIEIAVLEGALGSFKLENRSRLNDEVAGHFAGTLEEGAPLNADQLERRILLLTDQAGVGTVAPVLRPGARSGTSDLTLELGAAPLASGRIDADNWGNSFTGRNRLNGQVDLASPLGLGDSLGVRVTDSFEGLTSGSVRFSVPLGGNGLKAGFSYTETNYQLGKDFERLQATGTTQAAGAFVSYPLVRSQRWNLNATLGYDAKNFEDRVGATNTVTPKRTRSTSATLGGDLRDPLFAGGVFVWSITATDGLLTIGEPVAAFVDDLTVRTQGEYRKYSFALLYLQSLGSNWSVYASALGQRAQKNLDSSEKFSLGGAQGVRAYPSGEAPGDEGELGTLELRYALPQWRGWSPSLVAFADAGHVRMSKEPFLAAVDNNRSLGAAGLGVTVARSGDFAFRAYVAGKLGNEKAVSDADRSSRAWLQAAKYF